MNPAICSVDGCGRSASTRGWCSSHYMRWYRTGDPTYARRTLPRGEAFWNNQDDSRHGTSNGYLNYGCRCGRCTEAWAQYHLAFMHAKPSRMEAHAASERYRNHVKRQRGAA